MKKLMMLLCFVLVGGFCLADPVTVDFKVGIYDLYPLCPGHGKMPLRIPTIILDDSQVYFHDTHPDYTLTLLNEDGDVVYSTVVPAGTSTVTLPATLTGDYELRLYPDGSNFYFYGDITL